jgi:hypothetical protein
MKVQDHIEYSMKRVQRMIANAPVAQDNEDIIQVSKSSLLHWIEEINKCILEMEDIYEVTDQAQESARIRTQKRCDRMLKETRKTSDDIYASSLLYMEDVMKTLYRQMDQFKEETNAAERAFARSIDDRMARIENNHKELKRQMQKTIDDQTYEILVQKIRTGFGLEDDEEEEAPQEPQPEENPLPWRDVNLSKPVPAPEIKVDEQALRDIEEQSLELETGRDSSAQVKVHMDAKYFHRNDKKAAPDGQQGQTAVQDAQSGQEVRDGQDVQGAEDAQGGQPGDVQDQDYNAGQEQDAQYQDNESGQQDQAEDQAPETADGQQDGQDKKAKGRKGWRKRRSVDYGAAQRAAQEGSLENEDGGQVLEEDPNGALK